MHAHSRLRGEDGWAVLQTVIVAVVASAVVAVAVPLVTAGARDSRLRQNAATLKYELGAYLAQDLDPRFVAADEDGGAGRRAAAAVFTRALRGPHERSAYYVNPYGGSRAVVCGTQLPCAPGSAPPAVWITDDQRYRYASYRPSAANTSRLRGTLIVAFIERGGRPVGIDVYYVAGDGRRSHDAGLLAL